MKKIFIRKFNEIPRNPHMKLDKQTYSVHLFFV